MPEWWLGLLLIAALSVGVGVLQAPVAAISAGVVAGKRLLDLNYIEDSKADVDLNVVASGVSSIIEIQGTAERAPVPRADFDGLVDLGLAAMIALRAAQDRALTTAGVNLALLGIA
jgi:ribonuclease PH